MSRRYTLAEVVSLYIDGYGNSQTRKTKNRDLQQFLDLVGRDWYVDEVTWMDLRRYAGKIGSDDINQGKPYHPNTRRTKLKSVRIFFNWCVKNALIKDNPTNNLQIPPEQVSRTREKAFDRDDIQRLLDYAEGRTTKSGRRLRDLALVLFCHDTGVRRGALARMVRGDVDLDRRTAIVTNTKIKGGPRRYVVQFSFYTARVLREWFEVLPEDAACYLWNARTPGKAMSPDAISQVVGRMCDEVGIRRLSVHALRRHVGFRMADAGANENDIANVLDNSPEVAARYYMPHDTETAWRKNSAGYLTDPEAVETHKTIRFDDVKRSG